VRGEQNRENWVNRVNRVTRAYVEGNRQSAAVILADVARYGGEESVLVTWARTVKASPKDSEAGPLFRESKSGPEAVSQASVTTTKS
jgi:hypothetical protein